MASRQEVVPKLTKVSFIATVMEDKGLSLKIAQMPHADKFQLHITYHLPLILTKLV